MVNDGLVKHFNVKETGKRDSFNYADISCHVSLLLVFAIMDIQSISDNSMGNFKQNEDIYVSRKY